MKVGSGTEARVVDVVMDPEGKLCRRKVKEELDRRRGKVAASPLGPVSIPTSTGTSGSPLKPPSLSKFSSASSPFQRHSDQPNGIRPGIQPMSPSNLSPRGKQLSSSSSSSAHPSGASLPQAPSYVHHHTNTSSSMPPPIHHSLPPRPVQTFVAEPPSSDKGILQAIPQAVKQAKPRGRTEGKSRSRSPSREQQPVSPSARRRDRREASPVPPVGRRGWRSPLDWRDRSITPPPSGSRRAGPSWKSRSPSPNARRRWSPAPRSRSRSGSRSGHQDRHSPVRLSPQLQRHDRRPPRNEEEAEEARHAENIRILAENGHEHVRIKKSAMPRSVKFAELDVRTYFEGFGVDKVRKYTGRPDAV